MSFAICRSDPTVGMGKLFLRTALSHFGEAEALENCHHLTRTQDQNNAATRLTIDVMVMDVYGK